MSDIHISRTEWAKWCDEMVLCGKAKSRYISNSFGWTYDTKEKKYIK